MNIKLYSTGCPKCKVLEKKLIAKKIDFVVCDDEDEIRNLGFISVPILAVDNEYLDFVKANSWINNYGGLVNGR